MIKTFLLLLFSVTGGLLLAQISRHKRDSMIALLPALNKPAEKIDLLNRLSLALMGDSLSLSDSYGTQQIMVAEESREPWLIITAYMNNAARYRYISGNSGNLLRSADFSKRALGYSESVKNYDGMALAYTGLASVYRAQMNGQQALDYNNKAIALMPDITRDSVKVVAYQSLGNTYANREEKLPALKSYLNALQVAELSKNDALTAGCYVVLVDFYSDLGQYAQARDYAYKMLDIYRKKNDILNISQTYNKLGGVFQAEKQYDLAAQYYEKSYKIADSMKSESLVLQYNLNMLNLYLGSNQLAKGGAYFESHPEIASFIQKIGLGYQIDIVKAAVYSEAKKYDSSLIYFKKAEPVVEASAVQQSKYSFYNSFAGYYAGQNNWPKALEYMLKANAIAESGKNLEMLRDVAKELDTVYAKTGNMQQSALYKSKYYQYKDSLSSLSKEKDLVGLQLEDERKRQERLTQEKQLKLERKHNIQLMGLSIGIFSFLCVLLMLGRFRVSETLIRILSFIALIFLFEFIILIADQKIHHMTHGEPIKVILIKVVIAAILLPLHHVFEHKMIHYLTTRNKLKLDAGRFWNILNVRKIKQNTSHS